MGGGLSLLRKRGKKTPIDDDGEGSDDAKKIIALIKELEENIKIWTQKLEDIVEKDNAPKLELRFRQERAEMIRRLALLRHRPRIPNDDMPVISLSTYHRARGSTSATLRILKRGTESGPCLCGRCDVFCPNEFDLTLCANCNHKLAAHEAPVGSKPLPEFLGGFPARKPTRKEKYRMTQRSDKLRDPSYFKYTDDDRNAAILDPLEEIQNKGTNETHSQNESTNEMNSQDTKNGVDNTGSDEDSIDSADPEVEDEINQAHIEQELTENGFSAEAGKGMLTYKDGSHFDGEWAVFKKHGKIERHGYGTMHYASGEVHTGDFERDVRHGKGRLIHSDGSVFIGEWKYGEIVGEGRGAMPSADGSGKYIGQWYNGQRQGRGTMVSSSGDEYSGEWFDDLFHGFGTFIAANGDVYEGTFVRGEMTGFGTMKWANGDTFTGNWCNGIMHGDGTFTSGIDGSIYRGNFENGEKIGHGVIELQSGDSFSGHFEGSSTENVFGIIKTSAGDQFEVCPRDFQL